MKYTWSSPISSLSGVGKKRAEQLSKLKIVTLKDLIYHFPRAYEHRADVVSLGHHDTEINHAYILTVASQVSSVMIKKGMTISKFRAFDDSGSCEIIFFNSPFVKDVFHVGASFRFYGKTSFSKNRRLTLVSPKYEPIIDINDLPDYLPVYSLTEGVTSKLLEKLIRTAIDELLPSLSDPLPDSIRVENGLATLRYAVENIHFPKNYQSVNAAAKRLAFDEMLQFALGISMSTRIKKDGEGPCFSPCSLTPFVDSLPYELTTAQKKAINDIYKDTVIKKDGHVSPMSRIIIGDVGSGKTVCAMAAVFIAARSGYQSAVMVPTEILANQHYEDFVRLLGKLGISVDILTGSMTASKKKKIYESAENGEIDVVIGTHALLSEKLIFKKLGLVITDEQHRFGVAQRAVLKEKQGKTHMLVMSATPIPRTLALAMYGDLDISKINEMPKGRQRVDTFIVDESYRLRLNQFIKKQIELGGQCYVVCPAIEPEENDTICLDCGDVINGNVRSDPMPNKKNVLEFTEEMRAALPGVSIASLHGKMSAKDKESVIDEFLQGNIKVIVSTTVIEVGVNVPNASLMIVENAERYGLSQLHQLRGRVGRGTRKSYCVLVSDLKTEKSQKRLNVMRTVYDGFEIAEQDLLLRGPGEFFSSNNDYNLKQSGGFEFKMASICNDGDLLNSAFGAAKKIVDKDPYLLLPEHSMLKEELAELVYDNASTIS